MDRIRVVGGRPLKGIIPISGAKNAVLPLMTASLLSDQTLTIDNVPQLSDVQILQRILSNHGVEITLMGRKADEEGDVHSQSMKLTARQITNTTAPYELVATMRASFWVIAPLLARMGEARVSLPGGCAIGTRPVDLLLMALERLGAKIQIDAGYVVANAPGGLRGAEITFPRVTVGGTHVAIMAAVLAKGTTVIENAACEPEIAELADCLNKMGANVAGAGTARVIIEGVTNLSGAHHSVFPDRIEVGTYAIAAAMTGGNVLLSGARPEFVTATIDAIRRTGVTVEIEDAGIRIIGSGSRPLPTDIVTAPYPGFPTDLQAQFMALMSRATGRSKITETVFENRFMHVQEFARMGTRIELSGQVATVDGVDRLKAAPVMATDLRASVGLIVAGLAAEGETVISRVYHLDRGFERLESKLAACGAQIERIGS